MRRFGLAAAIASVLVASVTGCDGSGSSGPGADVQALTAAVRKWESSAPTAYVFTLEKSCFCAIRTPLRVTVSNGVVESAQVIATGAFLTSTELVEWVPTIPGVFAALAYAISIPAASYSARFDARWGFPTEASIDHWAQTIDDEVSYRLSDFVALSCLNCRADATIRP